MEEKAMKQTTDTIRKAAILVSSLEPIWADALLDQMGEEMASRVRRAAMKLGDVSNVEEQRIIQEFLHAGALVPNAEQAGIELDDSLLERMRTTEEPPPSPAPQYVVPGPFDSLRDTDPEVLAGVLAKENPQAIAVVLSHLDSHVASKILEELPDVLQVATLRRLSDLGATSPEIIKEVETHIADLLAECEQTEARRRAGLQTVKNILSKAESKRRTSMLGMLARQDNELAEQLGGDNRCEPKRGASCDRQWALPDPTEDIEDGCEIDVAAAWRARSWSQPSDRPWQTEGSTPTERVSSPIDFAPPAPRPAAEDQCPPESPAELDVVPIAFDQLDALSDSDLAMVFSRVRAPIAAIGLATARPTIQERVNGLLGKSVAAAWQHEVDSMSPLALGDIEYAQRQLGEMAARLVRDGTINMPATKAA
jgi:flagellar motor switch protein FliG